MAGDCSGITACKNYRLIKRKKARHKAGPNIRSMWGLREESIQYVNAPQPSA